MQYEKETISQIQKITWIGVIVNLFLSITKFILGYIGGSQAVIADAVHSLSDLSTDFAIIFGVKLWSKPADAEHPYGHRRMEGIVTIIIGIILVFIAAGIGFSAIINIRDANFKQPGWIALVGAVLSIVFKEVLYLWTIKVGKAVKSSALVANAWHHRTDSLSSIPVTVAVAFAAFNTQWSFLDHLGAVIVSLIILHTSWIIMKPAFAEMVDRGASKKYMDKIETIVLATKDVKSFHALRSRRMGSGWHIDLHIQVDPELTVEKGHEISGTVKRNIIEQAQDVLDVLVHIEPYRERKAE